MAIMVESFAIDWLIVSNCNITKNFFIIFNIYFWNCN